MTYETPNEFIRSQEKMKQSEQNERKDLNGCSTEVIRLNDSVIKNVVLYASLHSRIETK